MRSRISLIVHTVNSRAWRVEAGSNPGLHSMIVSFSVAECQTRGALKLGFPFSSCHL